MVNEKYFSGDERFFCYVMCQENKIKGAFSKRDFIVACRQYLELHPAKVKNVQQRYGKGYDAKVKAIKECIFELYKKYYGNNKGTPNGTAKAINSVDDNSVAQNNVVTHNNLVPENVVVEQNNQVANNVSQTANRITIRKPNSVVQQN